MSKMEIEEAFAGGLAARPRTCRIIPLAEVDNPILQQALQVWQSLKGERRLPGRNTVTPRRLKPFLRNTALLKVIDGGADYEYRIVGDAYVMAHGGSFQGLRWSETKAIAPGLHKMIKPIYDRVVASCEPLAMRGWVERGGSPTNLVYCEYLYLPLGEDAVDHILIVAVYHCRNSFEAAKSSLMM
jgi:hypothetical protein